MKKLFLLTSLLVLVVSGAWARQRLVDRYDLYAVQTGSMGQAAPIGSLVVSTPRHSAIKVGDIVTYGLGNGQVITHRVSSIDHGKITTKGDENKLPDPWTISSSQVRGVAADVIPNAGYALVYLTLPAGIASIFSALVTLHLAWRLFFPDDAA
jgi:signal peptidase I